MLSEHTYGQWAKEVLDRLEQSHGTEIPQTRIAWLCAMARTATSYSAYNPFGLEDDTEYDSLSTGAEAAAQFLSQAEDLMTTFISDTATFEAFRREAAQFMKDKVSGTFSVRSLAVGEDWATRPIIIWKKDKPAPLDGEESQNI